MQYICCLVAIIDADLDIKHNLDLIVYFLLPARLNWRERDLKQIPAIVNSKM